MRSSFTVTTGLKLAKSRGVREQIARRRMAVVGAAAGLTLVGVLAGALTAPRVAPEPASHTGPFSYFPSE